MTFPIPSAPVAAVIAVACMWFGAPALAQMNAPAVTVPAGATGAAPASAALGPVAVIGRGALERSGLQALGELFGGRTAYNAFGLYRAYSLGTVLIDGRRAEGLGPLPLSAIERIEIFDAGAGPIASGGAGIGTLNIVLRRDFEGAELHASGAFPPGGAAKPGVSPRCGAARSARPV